MTSALPEAKIRTMRHQPLVLNDDGDLREEEPVFEGSFVERNVARCRHFARHADWRTILITNFFLFTLLWLITGSMVMVKKTSARLTNYPFTLGQAQPIMTSFMFGVLYVLGLIWTAIHNHFFPTPPVDERSEEEKSRLLDYAEDEPEQVPAEKEGTLKWWLWLYFHLAVVGTFLSIGNILLFSGSRGTYVPGPISILLQQMTIPSTLIIAIVLFRMRFYFLHYLGAVVVIAGVILTLWPDLDSLKSSAKAWAVMSIVGAAISNAMGMAWMENFVVQTQKLSLAWMWMVINIFEIFTTLPLMFAVSPLQDISFSDTFPNIGDGYACLFGGVNHEANDDCEGAIFLYIPLILIFVASRMNIAYVVKNMNAALMWFVATCALPLANIAFTLHFIMGDQAISLNGYMIGGLFVVMAGLLMFRLSRKPEPKGYAFLHKGLYTLLCQCEVPERECCPA